MFKVVLILNEVHIRLKDGELDIILNKEPINILLGKNLKIINGLATINTTIQFYICENDAKFTLIFYILLGNNRKCGGNICINILESQSNVLNQTVTQIINSPDKNSRIHFQFYYFKQNVIQDSRKIFLSSKRYVQQYKTIKSQTAELLQEGIQLESHITQLKRLNGQLEQGQNQKRSEMNKKQCLHSKKILDCKNIILKSQQQLLISKLKRQKLEKLTQEYGIQCGLKEQELH